jgi:hypothetical protein
MLPVKAKTVNNMPTLILPPTGKFQKNAPSHVSAPTWKQVISPACEKLKLPPPNVILPPSEYLGFCDLVKRYANHQGSSLQTNGPAWRSPLEQLGIDDPQYRNALDHVLFADYTNRGWLKETTGDGWA